MLQVAFDRLIAVLAWGCRPALWLFPVLMIGEMAGLVSMEITIPFAAMAAIHVAGRRTWLAQRRREVIERRVGWATEAALG